VIATVCATTGMAVAMAHAIASKTNDLELYGFID
jgi:hypothetical protein